jgi:hypothetical protein
MVEVIRVSVIVMTVKFTKLNHVGKTLTLSLVAYFRVCSDRMVVEFTTTSVISAYQH